MTDDIKAIRDALAADGLTHGEWVACGPSFGDPLPRFLNEVVSPDDADGGDVVAQAPAGYSCSADIAYIAAVHPERIARLLDALDQAQKDADRLATLHSSLEDDGHGFWLPDRCFKEGATPPTMDEFRATIDAMGDA